MKSPKLRYFILLAIAAIVFFGNNSFDKNTDTNLSQFGIAHASLWVPNVKEEQQKCRNGIATPDSLHVPAKESFYLQDYEKKLYDFILRREYDTKLNWCVDKRLRNTGPFAKGVNYGTHLTVRMYYSPRMMYWLTGNPDYWEGAKTEKRPRQGPVPEGAMIIKEMFFSPAEIYLELKELIKKSGKCGKDTDLLYDDMLKKLITGWVVMVKDGSGSKDGWFWGNPGVKLSSDASIPAAVNRQLDDYSHMLYSSFGQPTCLRCHASAEKEFTFSTLKNVEGSFRLDKDSVYRYCANCPEENILTFYSDDSWRDSSYLDDPESSFLSRIFALDMPCLDSQEVKQILELPPHLLPWSGKQQHDWPDFFNSHMRALAASNSEASANRYPSINPAFVATFPQIPGTFEVKGFPSQWADHVTQEAGKTSHYITSDNCLGCHGGLGGVPPEVTMFIKTGPKYGEGYNVSEYGEWRWSPMGLAGRDPIFYAQLESEMALLNSNNLEEQVTSTCLSCHGAMGQRQLKLDARKDSRLDSLFRVEYVDLTRPLNKKEKYTNADSLYYKYGELAREGISCTVCHHIDRPAPEAVSRWKPKEKNWINKKTPKELAYFLYHNTTGQYVRGPADTLYGPFKDVREMPMQDVLGFTPTNNDFIKNSQLCGSCHTINLPNIGQKIHPDNSVLNASEKNPAFQDLNHTIEQATFLEWQNSSFGQFAKLPGDFKSCQDCHMPGGFQSLDGSIDIPQIVTKIATIQDDSYEAVENGAPHQEIHVPYRNNYKRHEHVGLNVFLLEMFNQFPEVLGVAHKDEMTYAENGNILAIENMIRQARKNTIDLKVSPKLLKVQKLKIDVTVTNKTGHRFPSGVSFRRAFFEVLVLEGDDVIWGSGRTNSVGVIVDSLGKPLKTEFLDSTFYQAHHEVIYSQDQVQIYEELNQNADYKFTTSFIHRVHPIKDNRLLPRGWHPSSYFHDQGKVITQYMMATDPEGTGNDPDYQGSAPSEVFPGMDHLIYNIQLPKDVDKSNLSVKVTMHYQSIPPYYLNQRFNLAPQGKATQRLFYLTSHLNLEGTAMKDWKLPLVSKGLKYCKMKKAWIKVDDFKKTCK